MLFKAIIEHKTIHIHTACCYVKLDRRIQSNKIHKIRFLLSKSHSPIDIKRYDLQIKCAVMLRGLFKEYISEKNYSIRISKFRWFDWDSSNFFTENGNVSRIYLSPESKQNQHIYRTFREIYDSWYLSKVQHKLICLAQTHNFKIAISKETTIFLATKEFFIHIKIPTVSPIVFCIWWEIASVFNFIVHGKKRCTEIKKIWSTYKEYSGRIASYI